MATPTFIHLRNHSSYSLSEGALPIKKLAGLAKDAKMPALAITDSNNLFGALEFSEAMAEKGIQPIIGLELKVDLTPPAEGLAKFQQAAGLRRFPSLLLIAKDEQGYRNLMKLSSAAFLQDAPNAEPHVSFGELAAHAAGLICLSGGPSSAINAALVQGQRSQAEEILARLEAAICRQSLYRTAAPWHRRPKGPQNLASLNLPMNMTFRWWPPTNAILQRLMTTSPTMP